MIHALAPILAAADPGTTSPITLDMTILEIVAVVVAVAALIGMGIILKFLQGFRKNFANEIRRELAAQDEPQNVAIQNPLNVREHVEYTPLSVHREFAKEVNDRLAETSRASSAGREKIYNLIRQNNAETQQHMLELERSMNARIDAIPERLLNVLGETKHIHKP